MEKSNIISYYFAGWAAVRGIVAIHTDLLNECPMLQNGILGGFDFYKSTITAWDLLQMNFGAFLASFGCAFLLKPLQTSGAQQTLAPGNPSPPFVPGPFWLQSYWYSRGDSGSGITQALASWYLQPQSAEKLSLTLKIKYKLCGQDSDTFQFWHVYRILAYVSVRPYCKEKLS